jgi:hypothetical protein
MANPWETTNLLDNAYISDINNIDSKYSLKVLGKSGFVGGVDLSGAGFQSVPSYIGPTGPTFTGPNFITKDYADATYAGGATGTYVDLTSNQTISGNKTFQSASGTTQNLIRVNKTIGTNPNGFAFIDNYAAIGYYDITSSSGKWGIDSVGNALFTGTVDISGALNSASAVFSTSSGSNTDLIRVNKNVGGSGYLYVNNSGNIGFWNTWQISAGGNFTLQGGITATATQTINFGTNAPTMSGANISSASIPDSALSSNIVKKNSGNNYDAGTTTLTNYMYAVNNDSPSGATFISNKGVVGYWNGTSNVWTINSSGNAFLSGTMDISGQATFQILPAYSGSTGATVNSNNLITRAYADANYHPTSNTYVDLSSNQTITGNKTFQSSSGTTQNLIRVNRTLGTNQNGFLYADNYGSVGYYDDTSAQQKWNIDGGTGNALFRGTIDISGQTTFQLLPAYSGSTGATVNSNNFITKQYADANYQTDLSGACLLNANNVFSTASGDILRSSSASVGYFYLNSNGEIGVPNVGTGTGYWWKIQNNGYAYFRSNENSFKHWAIEGNILRYYNLAGTNSIYMTGSTGLIENKATTITGTANATGNDANVLKVIRNTGGSGYIFAANNGTLGFTADASGLVYSWDIDPSGNCDFRTVISTKPIMSGSETSTGGLVRIGYNCAPYMTTGTRNNTMIGTSIAVGNNTTVTLMDNCVGIGAFALQNVSGTTAINEVVAIGAYSLRGLNSTSAYQNTAIGTYSGRFLTNGNSNTIIGASAGQALYGLTTSRCDRNSAIGVSALSTAGALPIAEATYVGPSGTFNNFTIPFMSGTRAGFYMYWYSSNGVPASGQDNSVMEQIQRYDATNTTIYTATRPIQTGTYLGLFAPGVLRTSVTSNIGSTSSTTLSLPLLDTTSIVAGDMFVYSQVLATDERFATVSSWNNTTKVLTLTTAITVASTNHTVYFYDVSTTAQNSLKGNGIFDNMAIGIGALMNSASNQIRMVAIGPGAGNAVGDRTSTNGRTFSSSFESVFIGYNAGSNVNVRGLCCKSIYIGSLCGNNGYATTFSNRSQNETICIGYQQNVWGDYQCCMGGTNNYWYFPTAYKAVFGATPDINSARTNYAETGAQGVLQVVCGSQSAANCAISCKAYNDGFAIINFTNTAGVARGAIAGINSTSVAYNTTSDERLKENIEDMPSQLDNIQKLKPRKFNWKSSGENDNGFIAQEYYSVYPERTNHKDLYPDEMLGMDYGRCTPYLWKGVSELIDIVKQQRAEIDMLKDILSRNNIV